MRIGKRWAALPLLSVLCVQVSADERSADAFERKYQAEVADLRRVPNENCASCFIAYMFGTSIPIPLRYVVQASPIDAKGCVTFVSPMWTLVRRMQPTDAETSLRTESGIIRYCPVAALQDEIDKIERTAPPDEQVQKGGLTVRIWRPIGKQSRVNVYVRSGTEALWISDPNPYLWNAMLDVGKANRIPSKSKSSAAQR